MCRAVTISGQDLTVEIWLYITVRASMTHVRTPVSGGRGREERALVSKPPLLPDFLRVLDSDLVLE